MKAVQEDAAAMALDAELLGDPYLTDEEALRLLAVRSSGVRPLLAHRGYRAAKRAFDIAASGAAILVLVIPSAALCAYICAKSSGASPIYSQWRIGRVNKDGSFRAFRTLKFRSMVPDADAMLKGPQEKNEASGPSFGAKDDDTSWTRQSRRSEVYVSGEGSKKVQSQYSTCKSASDSRYSGGFRVRLVTRVLRAVTSGVRAVTLRQRIVLSWMVRDVHSSALLAVI